MSRPGLSYEPPLFAWNVGSVVQDICARAGIPYDRVETDLLEGYVEGFSTNNAQSAAAAIEALAAIFMFDHANYNGMLHYIPRGGDSVADLESFQLIEDRQASIETSRRDALSVPRTVNLVYYDTDGGLTSDKQTSDRTLDGRSVSSSSTETTVIMRADDAARAVVVSHKVSIEEQRGDVSFSLPDSFLELSVSDVITLDGERLRITDENLDEGVQKYTCAYDRRSAYESTIKGLPIVEPSTPPSLVVGGSHFEFLDIPPLSSADDVLGYYMAVSSDTMDWRGATVELSRDGGNTWVESATTMSNSVMGQLVEPLAYGRVWYPDEFRDIVVQLRRPDMELLPATFSEVLNRFNLAIVGNELVNFEGAEQIDETTWRLTRLLRGRKGTPIPELHAVGERFVLLDVGLLDFVESELYDLNRALTFRITSIGADTPSQTGTVTFTGVTQRERAPAYLRARRVASDLVITWQGVGRLGGGASVGMGRYFAGYRVTLNGVSTDTNAQTLTLPYAAGVVEVRQLNSITGPGPAATVNV